MLFKRVANKRLLYRPDPARATRRPWGSSAAQTVTPAGEKFWGIDRHAFVHPVFKVTTDPILLLVFIR